MKALVASGLSKEQAIAKLNFKGVEKRFTHGDPFLAHRFRDYVVGWGLPEAAWWAETGGGPKETF